MFRFNNKDTSVFIVNFEHISHLFVVFLLLTLGRQMPAGYKIDVSRILFSILCTFDHSEE